jgi:hypothetical protein
MELKLILSHAALATQFRQVASEATQSHDVTTRTRSITVRAKSRAPIPTFKIGQSLLDAMHQSNLFPLCDRNKTGN